MWHRSARRAALGGSLSDTHSQTRERSRGHGHAARLLIAAALLSLLAACDGGAQNASNGMDGGSDNGASARDANARSDARSNANAKANGAKLMKISAPAPTPTARQHGQSRAEVYAQVRRMTALGKQMFFDPSLSGSGKMSCATCHSPNHAFTPANALDVQIGGADMHRQGMRAVPTLKYLQAVPAFAEHYHDSDDEGDESIDAGPTGGLTWDGRVDHGADQARIPLLSSFEMASTPAKVTAAVRAAPYANAFREAFGEQVFDDDNATFQAVLKSLETFEQAPDVFYPYTSKYDAYLAGKTPLTAAELRGLQLFNDEKRGNCASCHISQRAKDGSPPQFSDFGLIAIGVPRNRTLAVNRDPRFFDLGACGPERTDLDHRAEFCGLFRTPTLRNIALKKTFFHNGVYHSLDDVLRFYARRDTNPQEFYPVVKGKVRKFDDLPQQYWANLNTDPPFDRKPGDAPVFSDAEIKDVIAFLDTLTDGWQASGQAAQAAQTAH
ncbi:cytochrome c peroxidase [Paraburkholderia sp.]|uniref:cytochrome-c peroxidase n=1 Tax=Paraburkholderia sp. TaxID=1926495 RepID=UPI00286F6F7D|nr:cytochrome c peroxidase [Paraburkholderia sp.]